MIGLGELLYMVLVVLVSFAPWVLLVIFYLRFKSLQEDVRVLREDLDALSRRLNARPPVES